MMREERPKTLNRPVNAKLEQGHSAFTTNGSVATECQSQEQATVEHRKRRLDAALGR